MTPTEYEIIENKNVNASKKAQIINKYKSKADKLDQKISEEILQGATDEFRKNYVPFPINKIPSPVRIPCWMFKEFKYDPDFQLSDIEKVTLAHVIHFTRPDNPTGYMECSGDIENWCKVSPSVVHETLMNLVKKNLIFEKEAPEEMRMGHTRKSCYTVNVDYMHTILSTYNTDIWI